MNNFHRLEHEHVNGCPVCNSEKQCPLRYKKHDYLIYRCEECTAMFVRPIPCKKELTSIYTDEYFQRGRKYQDFKELDRSNPCYQSDIIKLEVLKRYRPDGRILDVGCALGGFLKIAQDNGYLVSGVEVSKHACSQAKDKWQLDVINSDLPSAKLPCEHYDIITLWDVIEHLDNPHPTLSEVYRLLRPGGLLVVSTGDVNALWARITGKYWQLLTPPIHLFFFTSESMSRVLKLNGFITKDFLYLSKVATLEFIMFKAREAFGPVVAPLQCLSRLLGLGKIKFSINVHGIMTCVAEKPGISS